MERKRRRWRAVERKRRAVEQESALWSLPFAVYKIISDFLPSNVCTAGQLLYLLQRPLPYLCVHIRLDRWMKCSIAFRNLRNLLQELLDDRHVLSDRLDNLKEIKLCFDYIETDKQRAGNIELVRALLKRLPEAISFYFSFESKNANILGILDDVLAPYAHKVTVGLKLSSPVGEPATLSDELSLKWLTSLDIYHSQYVREYDVVLGPRLSPVVSA